jgi:hypothetical protein
MNRKKNRAERRREARKLARNRACGVGARRYGATLAIAALVVMSITVASGVAALRAQPAMAASEAERDAQQSTRRAVARQEYDRRTAIVGFSLGDAKSRASSTDPMPDVVSRGRVLNSATVDAHATLQQQTSELPHGAFVIPPRPSWLTVEQQ